MEKLFVEVTPNFPLIQMPRQTDYFQIPLQLASKMGYDVIALADRNALNTSDPEYDLFPVEFHDGIWAILRRLLNLKPALVHGQGAFPAAYLSASVCGCPAVFTPHGLVDDPNAPVDSKIQKMERFLGPFFLGRFSKVICVTQYEYAGYKKRGYRNLTVLPNPVDFRYLSSANPKDGSKFRELLEISDEPIILHVSTIWEIKDPMTILNAYSLLRKRGKKSRLVMAGPLHFRSEDFKKKFLKKCSELGVILTGKIGREYLRGALAASSALVVSSVWETQCIVAYEAAAAGVSLCLSDIPTLKGAFGSLARYHQVGAYEKLADNLQDTLEGTPKGLKKKLKSFASKYSVENYEEGLKKIYTGTLDGEW